MKAHSSIGASTCERWWNCPGSVALIATLPPAPESAYAAEGTAAHELAELSLRTHTAPMDQVGNFSKEGVEFTEEMAEHVETYIQVIYEDMRKYALSNKDLQIEQKFHLTHIDKDAYGTNDANLRKFLTKIIVYDLKYGVGTVVEVEENKQGLYYASGAAIQGDYDEIEIVIVQPRAIHRDGPVRRWIISRADLDKFEAELKGAIANTRTADAPLRCGQWCQKTFCPALATCPEVKKQVQQAAMVVFDDKPVAMPDPASLTPLELRRVMDATPLIDAFLKAVQGHALAIAMRGESVFGYKLVRGKEGNRKWYDEEAVAATLGLKFTEEQIFDRKLKSPAQFEKLGKAAKAIVSPLVVRSEGRIMLVTDDDPREEVTVDATKVFDEVKPSAMIE